MNHLLKLFLLVILLPFSTDDVAADYQPPASFVSPKLTVTIGSDDYPVNQADDSPVFDKAISDVHAAGGGHVVVAAGEYQLINVDMKDDVHLIFNSGATISPAPFKKNGGNLFNMGSDELVKNCSIVGPEERVVFDFTDLPAATKIRAFGVFDCNNFRIANATINDNRTEFSSIILGWGGVEDGVVKIPRNGLIENITANDAQYGYGCLQAHSGENIIFRNIISVGGVAVRLETGVVPMNLAGVGGLENILVENVTSINGQGALMMQPHTMRHGDVVGKNISSDGSEFAVYISKPFVSKTRYADHPEMKPGSFRSIKIDGVKAVYRDGPIVTRFPHLKYYPVELHSAITRDDNGPEPGYRGPSIAAVGIMQKDVSNVSVTNVEAIGFKFHPDIITEADVFKGSVKDIGGPAPEKSPTKKDGKKENRRSGGNEPLKTKAVTGNLQFLPNYNGVNGFRFQSYAA